MVARNENYQNVFKFDQTEATLFDADVQDGDRVNVFFNGTLIEENLELTKEGVAVPLQLGSGSNQLNIVARNVGTVDDANTVGVRFPQQQVLFGESEYTGRLQPNQTLGRRIGLPKIEINGRRAPFTAQHIRDRLGSPTVLTIDRIKVDSRRKPNLRAYKNEFGQAPRGFERDEAPNATLVPGTGVPNPTAYYDVRAIPQRDNSSSGGSFNQQIENYGGKRLGNNYDVDFFATPPNYQTGITGLIGTYGTNNNDDGKNNPELTGTAGVSDVIYGFDGDDTLRGSVGDGADQNNNNSRDVLLGGRGNDRLFGRGDNDQLFGQQDSDVLFGGRGDDILNGGPGSDVVAGGDNILDNLFGRSDSDQFVLAPGEGTDFLLDFNVANDQIALVGSATPDNISLMQISQFDLKDLELPSDIQAALEIQESIRQGSIGRVFGGPDTTTINYQGETLGVLRGISPNELSDSNFIKYTDIDPIPA